MRDVERLHPVSRLQTVNEEAESESEPAPSPDLLPSWLVTALAAALVWCATAGAVGIALLLAGWYEAGVVGGAATLAALAAAVATSRGLGPRPHADRRAALAALALGVVFFAGASVFHSQHLLLDRDPAVYIATGRSIARTHELRPKTHVGAFASPIFGDPNTRYDPNFFPMLPVLLALGWSIGGDLGLLLVGPALGALGLLACYALASRVLGPRAGLLVPVVLMIAPLQLWFARDAYSEVLVQVVALGGLWLYLEARARARWGLALIGGALVASGALTRIDALAIVVGALVLVAAEWVHADPDATPVGRRVVAAFGGALFGGTLVALATTYHVSHGYITSLGTEYRELLGALVVAVVGVAVVVLIHKVRPGFGHWFVRTRYPFAAAVAASTVVFVWAYVWRPDPRSDLPVAIAGRPITQALRDAANNWHFSWSLHWFSAYFGLPALVVAFVGFVVLASRARYGDSAAAAVFLVVVPVAVMYIARPSISADQPWAMRRYLPVVIPGVAIAIVVALEAGWRRARSAHGSRTRTAAAFGMVAVLLLVTVPTATAAWPFARARAQDGAVAAVHHICRTAGHQGAVLVYGGHFLNTELPNALRTFCGIPVGSANTVDLPALARQWHALGRRLFVATVVPSQVLSTAPGSTIAGHEVVSDDDEPERVFDRAPRRFKPIPVDIWLLEVPATAN